MNNGSGIGFLGCSLFLVIMNISGKDDSIQVDLYSDGRRILTCYNASSGLSDVFSWDDDSPLHFSVPLLLAQISLIFITTQVTHFFLRRIGQPQVVSQIIAGIILGPSVLSSKGGFVSKIFPHRSWVPLNCLCLLTFILYVFVVTVKTNIRFSRSSRRKAFVIAQVSTIIPYIIVTQVADSYFPTDIIDTNHAKHNFFLNIMTGRWATTSHIVLSCVLAELNLLSSKLGRLAMTTSLIGELESTLYKAILGAFVATMPNFSFATLGYSFLALTSLIILIVFVARPIVLWMIKRTPEGVPMDEGYLIAVLIMAVIFGLIGEVIGQHVAMGAMLFGLVLPGGPPLGSTLVDRMEKFTSGVFIPVYAAISGLMVDAYSIKYGDLYWFSVVLVAMSVAVKIVAATGATMYYGFSVKESVIVALMLNCRGVIELYTFRAWQEGNVADAETYAIQIFSLVFVGGSTSLIIKLLYNPSKHFINSNKRRSITNISPIDELRVLTCAHDENNAPSLISLLETSLPNTTCVYLLHLIPLVGRTDSILYPYKRNSKKINLSDMSSISDHIVNAFKYFELCHTGHLTVQPFIGVSPYSTMHDDVCQLAFDKKSAMILLPFHKHVNLETGFASVSASVRSMNVHVLHYSPCSVGIYIDFGTGSAPRHLRSVAVYFLGGMDDREVLAYAGRMAGNEEVGISVMHLVLPADMREETDEEMMDEEAINVFKMSTDGNKRVVFKKVEVKDGAAMIEMIKETSVDYSLVMVGRREGEMSRLTTGLDTWSEYPELGIVGDMLASTDFGGKVSTLVVQRTPGRSVSFTL